MLHIFRKLPREKLIAALVVIIAILLAGLLLLTPRTAGSQDLTRRGRCASSPNRITSCTAPTDVLAPTRVAPMRAWIARR